MLDLCKLKFLILIVIEKHWRLVKNIIQKRAETKETGNLDNPQVESKLVTISFCLMTCSMNRRPVHAQQHYTYLWMRKQLTNAARRNVFPLWLRGHNAGSFLASQLDFTAWLRAQSLGPEVWVSLSSWLKVCKCISLLWADPTMLMPCHWDNKPGH